MKGLHYEEFGKMILITPMNGEIQMAIGRLLKSAIKYGPIAYPIIRKVLNKRKQGKTGQSVDKQPTTRGKKR
ncbi:hypothetical protein A1A1_10676 [Planococcus antarcticus DSM 14505]|uniref:Uncharacterized protein n=1 Tax=Planococcus antarcticus DSM 14505 TaxID=1185653 RepID=A0A1C7DJG9_9BACL|nr:hypothetical protein BBH88_16405 [Planococcus antarcticus DSM 14505]EIM06484.1 hypothetical protein A1A1_10676 [Planococcus antarcticus DSM 14505]